VVAVLPNSIYSPDHLRFCVNELKAYASALEQRDRGDTTALPELSMESADLLTEIKGADGNRPDVVAALAGELARHLEAAPSLTITLASSAPHGLKMELVKWLRLNVRREVMVEFLVNPDIGGGMILRTPNRVLDCTFRTKLLANPKRLTALLEQA
jgi:hypothetical protein